MLRLLSRLVKNSGNHSVNTQWIRKRFKLCNEIIDKNNDRILSNENDIDDHFLSYKRDKIDYKTVE